MKIIKKTYIYIIEKSPPFSTTATSNRIKTYIIENSSPFPARTTSIREEWFNLLRRCNQNRKVPGSNTARCSDGPKLAVG